MVKKRRYHAVSRSLCHAVAWQSYLKLEGCHAFLIFAHHAHTSSAPCPPPTQPYRSPPLSLPLSTPLPPPYYPLRTALEAFDRAAFSSLSLEGKVEGFLEVVSVERALRRMVLAATRRARHRRAETERDLARCA